MNGETVDLYQIFWAFVVAVVIIVGLGIWVFYLGEKLEKIKNNLGTAEVYIELLRGIHRASLKNVPKGNYTVQTIFVCLKNGSQLLDLSSRTTEVPTPHEDFELIITPEKIHGDNPLSYLVPVSYMDLKFRIENIAIGTKVYIENGIISAGNHE